MKEFLQLGRGRNFVRAFLPAAIFGLFSASTVSIADVIEIPPFVGSQSETWEEFPVRHFGSSEIILGGTAVVSGERLETATFNMFSLCAFYTGPTDGRIFMGSDSQSAFVRISFSQPVSSFGAYWASIPGTPSPCNGSKTHFTFTDASGNQIGEATYPGGDGGMHWRGYAFSAPVKTIEITGDYVVTDGMQATAGAPSALANISTRLRVDTGDNALIGGFIISGNAAKNIALRGIGPSLTGYGISDALADPTLELRDGSGGLLFQNDNWQDNAAQASQLTALGLAPQHPNESGIVATLQPGGYTAILAGKNSGTGAGVVEVYDTDQGSSSQLANISTRGFVRTGANVMIGGFILGGGSGSTVVVRGLGPSLTQSGLNNVLADPTLELRDSNGALLSSNDNWQDDPASAAQLAAHGLALPNPLESGILASLPAGAFTAISAGKNGGTGVGLVEIYHLQ